MALQLEKIFLGNTPHEQRKFITAALSHLRERHPHVVVPCCGQFSLAKCAIEAGYRPEQIETSDISLFSSLLGHLYAGRPVRELPFTVPEEYRAAYRAIRSETKRVAFLLWLMKLAQLRPDLVYERRYRADLEQRREQHVDRLAKRLEALRTYYRGIRYELRDLRAVLEEKRPRESVVLVNPPAFAGGYEAMFAFEEQLGFDAGVEQFDFGAEYETLYSRTRRKPEPHFWYRYREAEAFDEEDVVFGCQYDRTRVDYWLCTKPQALRTFGSRGRLVLRRRRRAQPYPAPIFGPDDEIRPDSHVDVVPVPQEVALYYRDLWAHKLGQTVAEQYCLALVDGKVFATVGLMLGPLFRLATDRLYENFGFSAPSTRYPRANRLLMLLLTCRAFADAVRATASSHNRLYELRGLQTTCLSKYRKVKLNNGVLEIEEREKLDNEMYRIVYYADFREEGFDACVQRFLAEEAAPAAPAKEGS